MTARKSTSDDDGRAVRRAFAALVNMSADELEQWLETPDSLRVGAKKDGGESIGHASGRRIVQILREPDSGPAELAHMRKWSRLHPPTSGRSARKTSSRRAGATRL